MREIRHENLVPFLGACVVPPGGGGSDGGNGGDGGGGGAGNSWGLDFGGLYVVTPFCGRGGLDDVLSNENYRLDNMFAASLIADLAKVHTYVSTSTYSTVIRSLINPHSIGHGIPSQHGWCDPWQPEVQQLPG